MANKRKVKKSRIKNYFGAFNFLGAIIGTVFVCLGFLPSLLPRGWILQGFLSGVLFAIGYALGLIISHFIRKFNPGEPKPAKKRQVKLYVYIVLAIIYLVASVLGFNWQQDVRKLVDQPPQNSISILGTVFVTLLIVAFILLIARSIRSLYLLLRRLINKHIPRAVSY